MREEAVEAARAAEAALWEHHSLQMRERFTNVGTLRVRLLECGDPAGPPLVFVQGGLGEAIGWANLLAELGDFRCLTLDRPGGGFSDPVDFMRADVRQLADEVLRALLDEAQIESAPFVANSMGAWWTLQLATRSPSRVSKLALLGCPALLLDSAAPVPMRLVGVPGIGRVMAKLMVPKSRDKARDLPAFLGHSKEVGARWPDAEAEAHYRFGNLPTFQRSWHLLLRRFLRLRGAQPSMNIPAEQLRRITQDTLLLWGEADPFGGPDVGRAALTHLQRARLEIVGTGHLPWWDEPAQCARLVREFVSASG